MYNIINNTFEIRENKKKTSSPYFATRLQNNAEFFFFVEL